MADIIWPPPSPPSFISCISPGTDDGPAHHTLLNHHDSLTDCNFANLYRRYCAGDRVGGEHLSVLAFLVAIFRKPSPGCRKTASEVMEIGWPSNVRHVAHVTFDRFDGFLGLPVEFEPDVPRRPPSASTRVFGVSTESMQLSFDSRGNCVPTILLMMQRRLYSQGGLESEGIFRINPANGQEEYAREQLNNGVIPDNIDVHCLAGLIKAWFRELPTGLLDSLSPEKVMGAQSEDECIHLVRLLPPTESSLMDWTINLMADVAQLEHLNKMNAHNIAMVFAPNMTQMLDPLTALMYAVQVMNFLKTLVFKTLREREDSVGEVGPQTHPELSNEDHHQNHTTSKPINLEEAYVVGDQEKDGVAYKAENKTCDEPHTFLSSTNNILRDGKGHVADHPPTGISKSAKATQSIIRRMTIGRRSNSNTSKRRSRKHSSWPAVESSETIRDIIVNSPSRGEAWR